MTKFENVSEKKLLEKKDYYQSDIRYQRIRIPLSPMAKISLSTVSVPIPTKALVVLYVHPDTRNPDMGSVVSEGRSLALFLVRA